MLLRQFTILFLAALLGWTNLSSKGFANAEITTTEYLVANGLNFTCTVLRHNTEADETTKNIMMLHGFPRTRAWWSPLLQYWDETFLPAQGSDLAVRAVACDLRGISPGASPEDISEYKLPLFAEDVLGLADAAGFDTFELMGHDHGAGLAWYLSSRSSRVTSLLSFAIRHPDIVSKGLCGDEEDPSRVAGANYFNHFAVEDSASLGFPTLTAVFAAQGAPGVSADEPDRFQKRLWWYYATVGIYVSRPRQITDAEARALGDPLLLLVRSKIPLDEEPCVPVPEANKIGPVGMPTLVVCGSEDPNRCEDRYLSEYEAELLPNFEQVDFDCGHNFFRDADCADAEESIAVLEEATAFVFLREASGGEETPGPTSPPSAPRGTSSGPASLPIQSRLVFGMVAFLLLGHNS